MDGAQITAERWLPVVGYEGLYEVSDLGRVRSIHHKASGVTRPRAPWILAQTSNGRHGGHVTVELRDENSKRRNRLVHQLVLNAFIGPRPAGTGGAHDDGDPTNNRLGNLAWKTQAQNMADRERHGRTARGERHGSAKLTEKTVIEIRASTKSTAELARSYKVGETTISAIKLRRKWKHV
jgi:hypothetical protein